LLKKSSLIIISFLTFSKLANSQNDSLTLLETFGSFQDASSISTAREELIFAADLGTNKIYKFSKQGEEIANFGGTGLGTNELNQPYSIDASNGLDVLVADYQNNRIKRLDIKLNFITEFNFNNYNLTAESLGKIYNPSSVVTLSTGEIFVICDASNYKAAKINDFTEVSILFGSSSFGLDRLDKPYKAVKGNALDIWIFDESSDEILNFNNFGVFVTKIKPPVNSPLISIAYYDDNLYILSKLALIIYDLKKGQYSNYCGYPYLKNISDVTMLDKNTVLILTKQKVYKFKLLKGGQ